MPSAARAAVAKLCPPAHAEPHLLRSSPAPAAEPSMHDSGVESFRESLPDAAEGAAQVARRYEGQQGRQGRLRALRASAGVGGNVQGRQLTTCRLLCGSVWQSQAQCQTQMVDSHLATSITLGPRSLVHTVSMRDIYWHLGGRSPRGIQHRVLQLLSKP